MKKSFSNITVDSVNAGFKSDKGVDQAQLRQVVNTEYPSVRLNNSLSQGGLFEENEFNLTPGQTFESTRMAWISVPAGTSVEEVVARLANLPNARIGVVISHNLEDVLTDEQKAARKAELVSNETLYDRHVVKDSEGNIVQPVQFKSTFFATTAVEDIDLRPETTNFIAAAPANTEVNALQAVAQEQLETLAM